MKIEVMFFAQIKDALGCNTKSLEFNEGQTVDDVVAALRQLPGWDSVRSIPLSFAVNERVVDASHTLHDGDRLALLTPISGG